MCLENLMHVPKSQLLIISSYLYNNNNNNNRNRLLGQKTFKSRYFFGWSVDGAKEGEFISQHLPWLICVRVPFISHSK